MRSARNSSRTPSSATPPSSEMICRRASRNVQRPSTISGRRKRHSRLYAMASRPRSEASEPALRTGKFNSVTSVSKRSKITACIFLPAHRHKTRRVGSIRIATIVRVHAHIAKTRLCEHLLELAGRVHPVLKYKLPCRAILKHDPLVLYSIPVTLYPATLNDERVRNLVRPSRIEDPRQGFLS